jgi:glutaredoxin
LSSERPDPRLDSDDHSEAAETGDTERTISPRDRTRSQLGSIFLPLGALILGLLAADHAIGLPIRMPRSWYSDRALWVGAGLLGVLGGWYLMRSSDEGHAETGTPAGPRPPQALRFKQVVLYTRPGCHLCDVARETLEKYADSLPAPREVNIDLDPHLREQLTTCVPVVEIDGKIRFRGHINEVLLRRLIGRRKDEG